MTQKKFSAIACRDELHVYRWSFKEIHVVLNFGPSEQLLSCPLEIVGYSASWTKSHGMLANEMCLILQMAFHCWTHDNYTLCVIRADK